MNRQPITAQHLDDELLQVNETFYSIQGEGPWQGHPCFFIRLAGCNLRCTWCDTSYTKFTLLSDDELATQAERVFADLMAKPQHKRVVITGGEPFVQNITPLVFRLIGKGFLVQIETNGTLSNPAFPFMSDKVLIVCSPKAGRIHEDIVKYCRHYKYVIGPGGYDIMTGLPSLPTQEKGKRPPPSPRWNDGVTVWVMPLDAETKAAQHSNDLIAAQVASDYGFRLSMRLHKILGLR